MREPAYQTREQIAAHREGRGFEAAAAGLWCRVISAVSGGPASRSSAPERPPPTDAGSPIALRRIWGALGAVLSRVWRSESTEPP